MRKAPAPILIPVLLGLLAAAAPVRAAEVEFELGDDEFQFRHLECEIKLPEGWAVERDDVTVVARAPGEGGVGVQITREPFLYSEDGYEQVWKRQLGDGGLDAEVEKDRVSRYTTWRGRWRSAAAGGRVITVWRLLSEDNAMLYNVAFSAPEGVEVGGLAEDMIRSFDCTAEKREIVLNETVETLGTATRWQVPRDWEELDRRELSAAMMRLGVGVEKGWVKRIPGYQEPHTAVTAMVFYFSPYQSYGETRGSDPEGLTLYIWEKFVAARAKQVVDAPRRARGARHGRLRGDSAEGEYLDEQGRSKFYYAFGTKIASQYGKSTSYVIALIVDKRELLLERNYFKEVLGSLRED